MCRHWRSLSVIAVVAMIACGDPVGPGVQGAYRLARVDGASQPFVLSDDTFADGTRIVVELLADSLTIIDGTRLQRAQTHRTTFYDLTGHPQPTEGGWSMTADYVVREGRLDISYRAFIGQQLPLGAEESLELVDGRTLLGRRVIGGWCRNVEGLECPTEPRERVFEYRRP